MNSENVINLMRADWNARAAEDAHYYVAFGRRGQSDEEFFATGSEMVRRLENELRRLPPDVHPRARRALEIGCGPGRLIRPLARHFGEIHGIDISDEMIRLARERLADIPHAHPRQAATSDLAAYADDSFDFVYSYAVFQHIPSRDVVLGYLRETRRVLKPGGIARFQLNGLPETTPQYDTWNGVRISAADVGAFARDHDFQLLALEGMATQYLWTTWRKQPAGWVARLPQASIARMPSIRRVTNAFSSEPVAPTRGRFAVISVWVHDLPPESDLNFLAVRIGGMDAFVSYIGLVEMDGLQQVNAQLPNGLETGLQPVSLLWCGNELCPPAVVRVVPPGPPVPRVVSVTDGVDLLSQTKIVSGTVKIVLEETDRPEHITATLGGRTLAAGEIFCTDPRLPKHEINFRIPGDLPPGPHPLEMSLGRRRLPGVLLELARGVSGVEA